MPRSTQCAKPARVRAREAVSGAATAACSAGGALMEPSAPMQSGGCPGPDCMLADWRQAIVPQALRHACKAVQIALRRFAEQRFLRAERRINRPSPRRRPAGPGHDGFYLHRHGNLARRLVAPDQCRPRHQRRTGRANGHGLCARFPAGGHSAHHRHTRLAPPQRAAADHLRLSRVQYRHGAVVALLADPGKPASLPAWRPGWRGACWQAMRGA